MRSVRLNKLFLVAAFIGCGSASSIITTFLLIHFANLDRVNAEMKFQQSLALTKIESVQKKVDNIEHIMSKIKNGSLSFGVGVNPSPVQNCGGHATPVAPLPSPSIQLGTTGQGLGAADPGWRDADVEKPDAGWKVIAVGADQAIVDIEGRQRTVKVGDELDGIRVLGISDATGVVKTSLGDFSVQ